MKLITSSWPSSQAGAPLIVIHNLTGSFRSATTSVLTLAVLIVTGFLVTASAQVSDTSAPESATLLSRYVQYPSVSGNERPAALFLDSVCRAKGLHVSTLSHQADNYNFAASIFPLEEGRPNIILLNHMDVVAAGPESGWSHGAFSGAIADGRVWGRGTLDMKGMAIMQILATSEFKRSEGKLFPYNVTVLFLSREEADNGGAKLVVDKYYNYLNPVVVLGEGGAGISGISSAQPEQVFYTVSNAEKRVLWLEIKFEVPSSGHGAVPPHEYTNKFLIRAMNRLMSTTTTMEFNHNNVAMLKSIGRHEKGVKKFVLKHPRLFKSLLKPALAKEPILFATLSNTITVTNITNPALGANQIAQEARVVLDCRLLPGTDQEQFIGSIREKLGSSGYEIEILHTNPKAPVSPVTPFLRAFEEALDVVRPASEKVEVLFPAYTDNTYFRQRGVPVYGLNPVHMNQEQLASVHNFNEYITIDQLEEGRFVYLTFLRKVLDQERVVAIRK